VQIFTRRCSPPIVNRADCRFGRKRRFVCRLEWLTLLPDTGPLPQISHR
jgi:hypothetical protein